MYKFPNFAFKTRIISNVQLVSYFECWLGPLELSIAQPDLDPTMLQAQGLGPFGKYCILTIMPAWYILQQLQLFMHFHGGVLIYDGALRPISYCPSDYRFGKSSLVSKVVGNLLGRTSKELLRF